MARRTWAHRVWPDHEWIAGEGDFASVSFCPPGVTVVLCGTREDAARQVAFINGNGCGGRCTKAHRIVERSEGERTEHVLEAEE